MSVFAEPVCTYLDNVFTTTDLLNVQHDFPESSDVYFGNPQQTVICVSSPFNPANQWCSPKADTTWTLPPWQGPPLVTTVAHITTTPSDPPCNPDPAVTPEPAHVALMLAVLFVLMFTIMRGRRTSIE